jgi:hypothetical protein
MISNAARDVYISLLKLFDDVEAFAEQVTSGLFGELCAQSEIM